MNHSEKKALSNVVETLNKIDTYGHIRQLMIDHMWTVDVFTNGDFNIEQINKEGVKIKTPFAYIVDYDLIVDKTTQIHMGDQIKLEILLETKINGVNFCIDDYVVAYIPDEEMRMLEIMGKVVSRMDEATISKSVFCPYGG